MRPRQAVENYDYTVLGMVKMQRYVFDQRVPYRGSSRRLQRPVLPVCLSLSGNVCMFLPDDSLAEAKWPKGLLLDADARASPP